MRFGAVDRDGALCLEDRNRNVLTQTPPGSAIPDFIMNSTALNSGAPFRFSSEEIGDPRLGYFRHDEVEHLEKWKNFLDQTVQELKAIKNKDSMIALALWWLTRAEGSADEDAVGQQWKQVFERDQTDPKKLQWNTVIDSLCKTNFRRLRVLKLSACSVLGQRDHAQHLTRFITVLREVEPKLEKELVNAIDSEGELGQEFLTFVRDLYYIRSAEHMSPRLRTDFDRISLGLAVAASANFPPVFSALIHLGIYDDRFVTRLGLTDGGVYDNIGITTLVDEGCTDIIASDTGAPFELESASPKSTWGTLSRLFPVLTDDVADHQKNRLQERWKVSHGLAGYSDKDRAINELKGSYALSGLALFGIDTLAPPGAGGLQLERQDRLDVAALRTDLDAFGDLEVAALVNAGYDRADRLLRANLKELPYSAETRAQLAPVHEPHHLSPGEKERLPKVLKIGGSRVFRALHMRSPEAWLFTLLVVALLFWLLNREGSFEDLLRYPLDKLLEFLRQPLSWLPTLANYLHLPHVFHSFAATINSKADRLVETQFPLWLLLVAAFVIVAVSWWWPRLKKWLRLETPRRSRFLATSTKWLRAALPMVLLLLVAPVPILIAFLAMVVGWVSYIFYNRPFLRATRTEVPIIGFPRSPRIVWLAARRKPTVATGAKFTG
jgi:predicted acylesterase/phospholipase RssA